MKIAETLRKHASTIEPGKPFAVEPQHIGKTVAQGNLYMKVHPHGTKPPKGYERIENPTDADRQLAVEAGAGSKHRIRSWDGATLYRPTEWGKAADDLRGPFVVFDAPNAVVHEPGHDKPHGTVEVAMPCCIEFRQQRNLTSEMRAIRARD